MENSVTSGSCWHPFLNVPRGPELVFPNQKLSQILSYNSVSDLQPTPIPTSSLFTIPQIPLARLGRIILKLLHSVPAEPSAFLLLLNVFLGPQLSPESLPQRKQQKHMLIAGATS